MITPSDLQKIKKFNELSPNHKRVFRHRLTQKCIEFQKDLELVILNADKLGIKVRKVFDLSRISHIFEAYQSQEALQSM